MHSLRGSNNRNRGNGGNVQNANRLFDSQNNNKGGYCWGPTMTFYEESYLQVEWTNQHGCGTNHQNMDCDVILQYMCHPALRDGTTEDTITDQNMDQKDANGDYVYGMHEPYSYYRKCTKRDRNGGLFAADQGNLQDRPATFTRQDNAGTKYGFECPEERDYYPYWHPTPWKDIAIFTSNPARCGYFEKHSQNVEDKWWCESDATDTANVEQFNNAKQCGEQYWKRVSSWGILAPKCFPAGWNRDNHLGNGIGGYANTYKWILPSMGVITTQQTIEDPRDGKNKQRVAPCVLRIRYNTSSGDFKQGVEFTGTGPQGFADSTMNGKTNSPVTQDPYVQYGKPPESSDQPWYLALTLNTDQYSRTFEDRSHMFYITGRNGRTGPIYNLMVRGKRGNIVQTYPAVEYDFTPNTLNVNVNDYIHFQWTGCDTNPGGQAGSGRDATDRSNFVLLKDSELGNGRTNYPKPFEKVDIWGDTGSKFAQDLTFKMAYINQYNNKQCKSQADINCCYTLDQLNAKHGNDANAKEQDIQNCFFLNANGANYFDGGLVAMSKSGTYNYMSSRNNNFTNRSHKGVINVSPALSAVALTATVIGSAGFAAAAVVAGGSWYAASHPGSAVANIFANVKA
jgi:hypothetical protein